MLGNFLTGMLSKDTEEQVLRLSQIAAGRYTGRDWHKLTDLEQSDVTWLEELGLLIPNQLNNGFAGRLSNKLTNT